VRTASRTARVVIAAVTAQWLVGAALAQKGAAQVGRAVQDFAAQMRGGRTAELSDAIRRCYQAPPTKTDAIPYCFALDYSAMRLDQALATKSSVPGSPYLIPEKVLKRANRAFQAIKVEQAQRGVLIAFWSTLSRSMLEKLPAAPSSQAARQPAIEQARTAILRLARDPKTARVSGVEFRTTPNMRGEPTDVVCGRMAERTQNRSYADPRPFVFFVLDGSLNYDNGRDDLDREIVKNFCVK
jgi:hypothetical protein